MMGTPFVMVYRVSPLTYRLGRPRVKVPYFAMVNLIAGKEIVPELVQQDFTAEKVVARLERNPCRRPCPEKMIDGLDDVRARHGGAFRGTRRQKTSGTRWIGLPRLFWRVLGAAGAVKNRLNLVLPASFASQSSSYGLSYLCSGDCF